MELWYSETVRESTGAADGHCSAAVLYRRCKSGRYQARTCLRCMQVHSSTHFHPTGPNLTGEVQERCVATC